MPAVLKPEQVDTQRTDSLKPSVPSQALSGVLVLDLSQGVPGPYCTKLLADYGAEVIKVEPPAGDCSRRAGPFHNDRPHPEGSGLFLHLNTNKRSITLNPGTAAGLKILKELAGRADILVESLGPGALDDLGLPFQVLEALNPGLVVTSITDFGQTGPYRDYKAYEVQTYAMGGPMYSTGFPDREPVKTSNNVSRYHTGSAAAVATMMALYRAEMTGRGDYIDVSAMETHLGSIDRRSARLLAYQYTGIVGPRSPDHFGIASGPHPCLDGYINMLGGEFGFQRIFSLIDREDLLEDPRFSSVQARARPENIEAFEEYLLPWLTQRTKEEVWGLAQEARIPSGVINTSADLLNSRHFQERGMWTETCLPIVGRVTQPGRPFKMYRTPWLLRSPAPTLGQHNVEVLCGELGYTRAEVVKLRETGAI